MPNNGPYYEKGRYRGAVVGQAMGKNQKGNAQFVLKFKVLAKENYGEQVEVDQQYERTIFRVLNENTMPYFLEDLQALGFHGASFRDLDPENENHQSFVGQEFSFYCKHDTYDGKTSEKWSIANSGDIPKLEKDELRKLDTLFGAQLKGLKKKEPSKPQPVVAAMKPKAGEFEMEDSGVPF